MSLAIVCRPCKINVFVHEDFRVQYVWLCNWISRDRCPVLAFNNSLLVAGNCPTPNPFLLPSNTVPLIVATRLLNDSVNFVVYYLRANILVWTQLIIDNNNGTTLSERYHEITKRYNEIQRSKKRRFVRKRRCWDDSREIANRREIRKQESKLVGWLNKFIGGRNWNPLKILD